MNAGPDSAASLPLRRDLTPMYALSFIIAILLATASIAGILFRAVIYPTDELLQAFVSNDVVNLCIGLPILLCSMWLARRGKLIGLLFWPGALFFALYNYIVYVFAMPLNVPFLLHLALVMLSMYTLIGLVASIDGKAVQQRLAGAVPERFAGGVLAGLGFLFFLRAISVLVTALTGQTPLSATEIALNMSDFLTSPAWVVCGVLLWRRKEFGYVTGLGMLFQASMLFIGLIIFLLLQPILTTAQFVLVDVVVISIMGLICFIPCALFVRGVVSVRGPSSIEIYVKDCPNDRLFAWIESAVGQLGEPENFGDATLYPSALGPVIVTPNIQDGPFVGVEFILTRGPWATAVDCGRQAARELGCIVRCEPGQHYPEVDPLSDAVLEIDGDTERIRNWD